MSDKWKAKVLDVGGQPVVILDVRLERTLIIEPDMWETSVGSFRRAMTPEISDFLMATRRLPPEAFRYMSVPWTNTINDDGVGIGPFAELVTRSIEERISWRIEGTPESGLKAVLNNGGIERVYDMQTPHQRQQFDAQRQLIRKLIEDAYRQGSVTEEIRDRVIEVCVQGDHLSDACQNAADMAAEASRQRDKAQREQQQREASERFWRDKGETFRSTKGRCDGRNFSGE